MLGCCGSKAARARPKDELFMAMRETQKEIIELTSPEEMIRAAGIMQGRRDAFRECASQLRQASSHYREQYLRLAKRNRHIRKVIGTLEEFCVALERTADSVDSESDKAKALVPELIQKAVALRITKPHTLQERLRGAIIGLVQGFNANS